MKIWKACFGIELKRTCKVLAQSVAGFLFFCMLSIALMVAGSKIFLNSSVLQKIQIGVSIPQGESLLKMASHMVANMDSVESVADFYYLSEDEALEKLDNDELAVVIVIPESFYEDVDSGENPPAILYFNENSTLSMEMFAEVVRCGVQYLQSAESGVYATADATRPYQLYVDRSELGDTLANMYMDAIMDREDIYRDSLNSPFGKLQVYGYYFAAGALVLMLFMGILFPSLYHKRNRGFEEKLRIYGMKGLKLDSVKILIMGLFMSLVWILLYAGAGKLSDHYRIYAVDFSWLGVGIIVFLSLALASFYNLIYSYLSGSDADNLCLLAVDVIMVLCSGMLIPTTYLPHWMEIIGDILPLKHFFALFGSVIIEDLSKKELAICILYMVIFLFFSVFRDRIGDLKIVFSKNTSKPVKEENHETDNGETDNRETDNHETANGEENHESDDHKAENSKEGIKSKSSVNLPAFLSYCQIQMGEFFRRKSCWLQLAFFVFVLIFAGSIRWADTQSTTMGVYCDADLSDYGHDDYDARVVQCLLQCGSLFDFQMYDNKEQMEEDVLDGSIECAFAFSEDFNEAFAKQKLDGLIEYIYTPLTTKGYAARETVFSAVLAVYGEQLNKSEIADRLYTKEQRAEKYAEFKADGKLDKYENLGNVSNEELLQIMNDIYDEQNSFYNESEDIFHLECYIVEPGHVKDTTESLTEDGLLEYEKAQHEAEQMTSEEEELANRIKNLDISLAVAGILGFVLIMMNMSHSLIKDHNILYLMRRRKRYAFVVSKYVAVSLPVACIIGFVMILSTYYNEGNATAYCIDFVKLLLYIVETGIYAWIFNGLFRNGRKEISGELVMIATIFVALSMCIVSPFFIDLAEFVPAIEILRYISPLYWIV